MDPIAKNLGPAVTSGQLALAWVMKNERVSTAIIGATSLKQMEENLVAVEYIEKPTPEIMEEIDTLLGNKPKLVPWRY